MKDTPGNRYVESSLLEMIDAAKRLRTELETPRARTPDERRELTANAAQLLGMLAYRLAPQDAVPDQPEKYLKGGARDLVDVFMTWNQRELERAQHAVRHRTLMRAAHYVLGAKATQWIWPYEGAFDDRPGYFVHKGDDALRQLLEQLEAMQRDRSQGE